MNPPSRTLRFVLPIRTSKRKKEAKSPQQQRDLAFGWAAAHGHEIVAVLDSGRDESGKTMDRASIHEAMTMVTSDQADGIVFALTDRLGRAPIEESMTWIRSLALVGHLALADAGGSPVNLQDPNAETSLVLQLQIARQQWLATARRFRQSQRDAIKAGKFIPPTPIGYVRIGGVLHEDELYGPVVREAFRLAASDFHAAVTYLRQAVPQRRWDSSAVRRVLSSRTYLGENHYTLKEDPGNFPAEELVSPHRHDALTDPTTFDRAQTKPRMRRSNGDYILSHVATCGRCGAGMVGGFHSPSKGSKSYRRMRCSNLDSCRGGSSIAAAMLEDYVREQVAQRLGDRALRALLEPVGKEDAEAVLADAVYDRDQYLAGTEGLPANVIALNARRLQAAVTAAEKELSAVAVRCADREELPSADEVRTSDPHLLRAIRAGVVVLEVRPGRGTVEERVYIGFLGDDLDDRPRTLAA